MDLCVTDDRCVRRSCFNCSTFTRWMVSTAGSVALVHADWSLFGPCACSRASLLTGLELCRTGHACRSPHSRAPILRAATGAHQVGRSHVGGLVRLTCASKLRMSACWHWTRFSNATAAELAPVARA